MEGCVSDTVTLSEDVSVYSESSTDPPDPSNSHHKEIKDLGNYLTDSLNIQNDRNSEFNSLKKNSTVCLVKEDESNDNQKLRIENPTSKKIFNKSASFPFPCVGSVDSEESKDTQTSKASTQTCHANSTTQPYLRSSISLPSPSKLIPAIKGTREKLGNPITKLSVKWAPDVYDPIPSAASHVPTNKPKRGKRNGKNKQKGSGKSTHGSSNSNSSKGKEKKQTRKNSGSSSRSHKPDNRVVSSNEPLASIVDFEVSNSDVFCGSSFLKESVTKLHFSTAKAT